MKKLYFFVVLFFMSLVIAACGSGSESTDTSESSNDNSSSEEKKETIKLKFATYFPGTSPIYTDFVEPWMNRVTELTDGQVEFDYYPAEQLGKSGDLLFLTRDGVADLTVVPVNYYQDNQPISAVLASLPGLSETVGQGTKAYNELLKQNETILETDYLKNGVRPIVAFVSPPYELWTRGLEIRVPEDLKGKKIKTPGGITNELYSYLGAVPVTISHAETYEALEKGVIEIVSSYNMAIKNGGYDELLEYGVMPHIGSVIQSIKINENKWQSLPDNVKEAMMQAGEEVMDPLGKVYEEAGEQFNKDFIDKGGVIAELTEEELEKWNKPLNEFTEKWLKEHESDGHDYRGVLEDYKQLLEKYKES